MGSGCGGLTTTFRLPRGAFLRGSLLLLTALFRGGGLLLALLLGNLLALLLSSLLRFALLLLTGRALLLAGLRRGRLGTGDSSALGCGEVRRSAAGLLWLSCGGTAGLHRR